MPSRTIAGYRGKCKCRFRWKPRPRRVTFRGTVHLRPVNGTQQTRTADDRPALRDVEIVLLAALTVIGAGCATVPTGVPLPTPLQKAGERCSSALDLIGTSWRPDPGPRPEHLQRCERCHVGRRPAAARHPLYGGISIRCTGHGVLRPALGRYGISRSEAPAILRPGEWSYSPYDKQRTHGGEVAWVLRTRMRGVDAGRLHSQAGLYAVGDHHDIGWLAY